MSETKDTPTEPDGSTKWLERNAETFDPRTAFDTESLARAKSAGRAAIVVPRDASQTGRYAVELPDGEPHEVLLLKVSDDEYRGACGCDGWQFHDHPCAHICYLLVDERQEKREIPRVEDVREESKSRVEDAHSQPEELRETGGAVGLRESEDGQEPAPRPEKETLRPSSEEFATPLPDVPSEYVMQLNGETYIRRAGYARLAKQAGYRIIPVEMESPEGREKWMAKVKDAEGNLIAQDIGSAGPPDAEDMDGAEHNLAELAITRAKTRAASWATGAGLTAVVEVDSTEEERNV